VSRIEALGEPGRDGPRGVIVGTKNVAKGDRRNVRSPDIYDGGVFGSTMEIGRATQAGAVIEW